MAKKQYIKNPQIKRSQQKPVVREKGKVPPAKPLPTTKTWFSLVRKQYIFLALLAFGLYANTLDMNYALDDTLMIIGNDFTKKGADGIYDIFTNDAFMGFLGKNNLLPGGRYRPLSHVMFALEYEFFGFNPFIGHFINVIFYVLLSLLIFKLLRKLLPPDDDKPWYLSLPFIATALFIAHPLHTEVVANIKGRDEIMSMLGTLGALYFVLRFTDTGKKLPLAWAAVVFFLAILSKENALAYLVIIPLCVYFFRKVGLRTLLAGTLPLFAAIVGYAILRAATVGFVMTNVSHNELLNDPFLNATLVEKYATVLFTWGKYLLLLLFPHPLTHDYYPKQVPLIGFGDVRALIPLFITLAMGVFALWKLKRKSLISFAILFFWLSFVMSSNLVLNIGTFMNERFMFAPLLGFTLVVAWAITDPLRKWLRRSASWKTAAGILMLLVMVGYAYKTMTRNRVWKNDFVLFTTDVDVSTNSAKCNTSAGGKLMEWSDSVSNPMVKKEYLERSEKYLKRSAEIYPTNIQTWDLLGMVYVKTKDYQKARDCFKNCLKINPKYPNAWQNMLYVAQVTNRDSLFSESQITYRELMRMKPDSAQYIFGLGLAFKNDLKLDSAIHWFNKTLEVDSNYGDAYGKLGEIYGQFYMDLDRSEALLQKAISINPRDASSLENIGIIYALRKNYALSLEYFQKAYAITPDNPGLNGNIGKTYLDMGDRAKADEYFKKAQDLQQKKK
jgi:tetratricopeptide (TPR) repeat protein